MHPIGYSLILNLATLIVAGALAYAFTQPWLIIPVILMQTHAIQRFEEERRREEEDDEDEGKPMGFLADIK